MSEIQESPPKDWQPKHREKHGPGKHRRVKQWPSRLGRKIAAVTLSLSAVAAGVNIGLKKDATMINRPPGIEQMQWQQPTPKVLGEVLQGVEADPTVDTSAKSINLSKLRENFSPADYKEMPEKNIYGFDYQADFREQAGRSAPVMEITYNPKTGQLQVDPSRELPKELTYQLLSSFNDNVVLRTAFQTKTNNIEDVKRVIIRQKSPQAAGVDDGYNSYNPGESAIYIFLSGGLSTLSTKELNDTLTHEATHGLTYGYSLSERKRNGEQKSEDLKAWTEVCRDIRDLAVDDAEANSTKMLDQMQELKSQLNPALHDTFDEVLNALHDGKFNMLQPQKKDEKYRKHLDFITKVPDCQIIGPIEAFKILLMKTKGQKLRFAPNSTLVSQFDAIETTWKETLENNTILQIFREGTYQSNPEHRQGHPYLNWDELMTSTSTVLLENPTGLADKISRLDSREKRDRAIKLVQLSFITVKASVPREEKFGEFDRWIQNKKDIFNQVLEDKRQNYQLVG